MKLLSLLGLIFVVLKLCNVIAWNWIWVVSPFIANVIIFLIPIFVVIFGYKSFMQRCSRSYLKKNGFM